MPQIKVKGVRKIISKLEDQPKKLFYWYVLGSKAVPPPDWFKQRLVQRLGRQFGINTFVETGTFKGDMTAAAAKVFRKVYSVELNESFYSNATRRFQDNTQVEILLGDSGKVLRDLLPKLSGPAMFWLDAHGGEVSRPTGETEDGPAPLVAEIEAILRDSRAAEHVILVDDVHTFVRNAKWGRGVWGEVEVVKDKWLAEHPDWVWQVKDNVLRIFKKRS